MATDPTQAAREAASRLIIEMLEAETSNVLPDDYEAISERHHWLAERALLAFRQAVLEECRAELAKWPSYGDYCDALDRMIASPAPKEAAQKWRPIAEAPKDGRHILVADFTRWGFGYFEGVATAWQGVVHWWGNPGEEGFYLSSGDNGTPVTWATHWQLLPPPPIASAAPKEEPHG